MFIIGILVAIGVLVLVHESGHFFVARLFGVTVEKFSIGFGPRLFSFKKGETEYAISLIPLGGYVKMRGDEVGKEQKADATGFYGISWWKRSLIVFAGPFANLLLGIFLFTFSFVIGHNIEDHYPIIGDVSPLYESYFRAKDRILKLNGEEITHWSQLAETTKSNEPNNFIIVRDSTVISLEVSNISSELWWEEVKPQVAPIVGSVAPGMSAYKAGVKVGDKIISVAGVPVDNWYDMRRGISEFSGEQIDLLLFRDGHTVDITLPLEVNLLEGNGQKMIGITQYMPVRLKMKFGLLKSFKYSMMSTASFIGLNYYALVKMLTNPSAAKDHLGGPVMIVTMSHQTSKMGFGAVLAFAASISLILMIMNLLPIPVLDGGHIFFFILEGIFRKPLPLKVQSIIQQMGFFFLILLMIFAFYNDASKLIGRSIALRLQKANVETVK